MGAKERRDQLAQERRESQDREDKRTQQMMSMMERQEKLDRDREERFLLMLQQNNLKEDALAKANAELVQKLEQAEKKFIDDAGDPEKYEQQQTEIFQTFCDKV